MARTQQKKAFKPVVAVNLLRVLIILSSASLVWFMKGPLLWSLFLIGAFIIWIDYQALWRRSKEMYLTRVKYGEFFRFWGMITAALLVFLLVLPVFGLERLDLTRLYSAFMVIALGVFLPVILAELITFYHNIGGGHGLLYLLKEIDPYHRVFIKIWEKGPAKVKNQLLFLEPDAVSIDSRIRPIIELWLNIGELSPLSVIDGDSRPIYLFMQGGDESKERILDVENIEFEKQQIVLTVRTDGDLVADSLIAGKARAKLYEHFAYLNRPLKALSYNATARQIVFQFFLKSDTIPAEILDLVQKLELGFSEMEVKNSLNAYPQFVEYKVIDEDANCENEDECRIYSVKLSYKLPSGLPAEMISASRIENLASYVRKPLYQHKLRPYDEVLELYVELASRDMSKLKIEDFPPADGLRIALGFDLKYRKPVFLNFDQAEVKEGDPGFTPHLLIAGATASGKSSFIKFIIMQLLRSHSPASLRFFMVDPKVVTFSVFKKLPHLYAPIVSEAKKFQVILAGIVDEVEKRYKILAECDVENLYQLQSKFPHKAKEMPRILVIVDEFADIIDSHEWRVREQIILTLKKLGQKARAAGVHLILITQRATSTNIDSEVKANISGRICFKVAAEGDSQVVLEDPAAAEIKNPGEGFAKLGDSDELIHFQTPYVSDDELREAMAKYEGLPQDFLDQSLTEELLKKPLKEQEVSLSMLPLTKFPIVPIGINLNSHKPIYLMLARPDVKSAIEPTPHFVVAGATNSGKSQFAKLLIQRLALSASPDTLRLILIDPKAVTFVGYKKLPHLACPIVTKHAQLLPLIKEMLKIIEERYELFAEHEVENIEEYRTKTEQKLHSFVMIIDEFADLLDYYDFKERDEIEKILKRFGQMARAAGVHLIIITQRATSQNVSGEIRANFSGRVAFRMNSEADSFYILEESGAEDLESAGHFLIRKAHYPLENGYFPLIKELDIKKTVDVLNERHPKVKELDRLKTALKEALNEESKENMEW